MKRYDMAHARLLAGLAITLWLSACGGGGGGGTTPPGPGTPPPLLDSLTLTAPAAAEAGDELQFTSSAATVAGINFSWDFGDGSVSSDASPKHSFRHGGDFDIKLKISNAAGSSREQSMRVSITALNNVKGLVCSAANSRGWCWQQPLPSGTRHNDSFFSSATIMYVAGDEGELLKSTDAGASWSRLDTGVSSMLTAIDFSSAATGWVRTLDGFVLRTTDAGSTWTKKTIPSDLAYAYGGRLQPINDKTVIVGNSGLHTTDGGDTWVLNAFAPSKIAPSGTFWAMGVDALLRRSDDFGRTSTVALDLGANGYTLDPFNRPYFSVVGDEAVAAGWTTSTFDPVTQLYEVKHVLLLSYDKGQTWRRIEPKHTSGAALPNFELLFLRASRVDNTMLAISAGQLWSSLDGGLSWSEAKLPRFSPSYDPLVDGATVLMPLQGSYIYRPSELGGEYAEQDLAWSGDGGRTWTLAVIEGLSRPTYSAFTNLRHVEGNVFSMQDAAGRVFVSMDRGRNWKIAADTAPWPAYNYPVGPWYSQPSMTLAFFDAKRGLSLSAAGLLRETSDGGRTWTTKAATGLPATATNVALRFVNDKTGWLLQSDGRLYKSADGGATWGAVQTAPGGLYKFDFVDANRGWVAPSEGLGLAYTRDGGQTWTRASPPQTGSGGRLHFGEGQQIFFYGPGSLLASSTDDGKTWTVLVAEIGPYYVRRKVTASDSKTLWSAYANGLYRSEDGGASWTLAVDGEFGDIAFADATHGWAVGRLGRIAATTDGGKTWTVQKAPYRDLWRVLAVDAKTAWIEGQGGTVLATGSGGF